MAIQLDEGELAAFLEAEQQPELAIIMKGPGSIDLNESLRGPTFDRTIGSLVTSCLQGAAHGEIRFDERGVAGWTQPLEFIAVSVPPATYNAVLPNGIGSVRRTRSYTLHVPNGPLDGMPREVLTWVCPVDNWPDDLLGPNAAGGAHPYLPTSPYLTHLTSPYHTLPQLAYSALPCLTSPQLALPCLALPHLTSPFLP